MPETSRHGPSSETGFTLIELLVVIAIILIVASFALPAYNRIVTRSHEAVLRDDLFTMRQMLNRYTLDNHQPPESLDDLVKAGYLSGARAADRANGTPCQGRQTCGAGSADLLRLRSAALPPDQQKTRRPQEPALQTHGHKELVRKKRTTQPGHSDTIRRREDNCQERTADLNRRRSALPCFWHYRV